MMEPAQRSSQETNHERPGTDLHAQLAVHASDEPGAFCKGS
jgi:hypothetical protein